MYSWCRHWISNKFNLHSDLPFLPEKMTTKKSNKPPCNSHDKKYYVFK